MLSEFTVMDNVSLAKGTRIMDLFSNQNFLKRKDASCKTDWSKIARTGNRKITVDELYGAAEDCLEEFYQADLKDFRDMNEQFRDISMNAWKRGLGLDLAVNSYFGDITRAEDSTGIWSWNKYDGIFTKIAKYISSGDIPSGQVMNALPDGEVDPADAYDIFKEAYDKKSDLMDSLPELDLGFYVDRRLAKAYERYLQSLGNTTMGVQMIQNGIPSLRFEDIPIYVEPLFNPVLKALNGGIQAHSLTLTIRGNWVFGTNKTYGGGAHLDQALRVWWSEDDEVWRQKAHLVAGTEVGLPEHTVFGMTQL